MAHWLATCKPMSSWTSSPRLRPSGAARVPLPWLSWRNRLCEPPKPLGMSTVTRAHILLKGRVQGVGFRYATAVEARRRRLSGWVRNLDSGAVEAVFEGPHTQVAGMVRWCEDGPAGAYVRDVRVDWDEPLEQLKDFEI